MGEIISCVVLDQDQVFFEISTKMQFSTPNLVFCSVKDKKIEKVLIEQMGKVIYRLYVFKSILCLHGCRNCLDTV